VTASLIAGDKIVPETICPDSDGSSGFLLQAHEWVVETVGCYL